MRAAARRPGIDTWALLAALALMCIGFLAVYSATHVVSGFEKAGRQVVFGAVGIFGLAALASTDYRILARWRKPLYTLTIVTLLLILFAPAVKGAHSWVKIGPLDFQPSEFMKLALIIAFAALLTRMKREIETFPGLLRALAYLALPVLLVMAQPAFGTAMVFVVVGLVMLLLAGARLWMLAVVVVALALLFLLAWNVRLPGGRPLIKQFQKARLSFLHADPQGNGYHQRQALLGIGSGRLWGKGYLHSTQAVGGFLPEQETDFIFAIIGEEFGFLGCLVVLGLFGVLLLRLGQSADSAETPFGRLVAAGVVTMLAVHVFINVGMALTLLPVTGIPLPFISYGGSNLLTNLFALGVALNIGVHREERRAWSEPEALVRL